MTSNLFAQWVDRFLVPVDDAGSRLFHLNLLLALALVVAWIIYSEGWRNLWPSLRRLVLRQRYWWNRSTKIDYQVYILNSLFKIFLFIPFLDFSFFIAHHVSGFLLNWHDGFLGLPSTPWFLFSFTVLTFIWDDLLRFSQHVLMHKIPFLWRIHRMHHSARVLTPITLYRNHPLESAIATLRNSLSLGVATGLFVFVFEAQLNLITLFGVNLFGFLFNFLGANLRHSHVPIGFGPLEKVLISPKQHQIHHSREAHHFDRNFGVSLAVWDRLCGSLVLSTEAKKIRFGLNDIHRKGLWQHLKL